MWQRRMEIHAAMVDRMDREIGRVLDQVRKSGQWENTLVLFASDNGASAEKLDRGDRNDPTAPPGSAKSFLCIEPPWANLANAPLRKSKIFTHEGGISTPLIVHWPAGVSHARRVAAHARPPGRHRADLAGAHRRDRSHELQRRTAPAALRPQPCTRAGQRRHAIERDGLWWQPPGEPRLAARRLEDRRFGTGRHPGSSTTSPPTAARATTWPPQQPERVKDMAALWAAARTRVSEAGRQRAETCARWQGKGRPRKRPRRRRI